MESKLRAAGTLGQISGLQPGEVNDAMNDIMRYGTVAKGSMAFQHDKFGDAKKFNQHGESKLFFGTKDKVETFTSMDQAGKWDRVTKMAGTKEGVADLAELNAASGGAMADAMQKQLMEMALARKNNVTKISTWDSDGKRSYLDLNERSMKDMQAALKAVREATEALGKPGEKSANFENVTIKHATIERQD
jgi:hypothetical protein